MLFNLPQASEIFRIIVVLLTRARKIPTPSARCANLTSYGTAGSKQGGAVG